MNDITNNNNNQGNDKKKKGASSLWSSMKHTVSIGCARTVTGSKNTKELFKIKQLEGKREQRKEDFGVEYMELLGRMASPTELQQCVDKATEDIARLEHKMAKFQGYIDTNKEQLERKIKGKTTTSIPGANAASTSHHTSPSIVVTSAEFASVEENEDYYSSSTMADVSSPVISPSTREHEDDGDGVAMDDDDVADGSGPTKESSQPFDEDRPLPHPKPSAPIEGTTMQSID